MASFQVRGSTLRGGDAFRGDSQLDFSVDMDGGIVFSGVADVGIDVNLEMSGGIVFGGAARLSGRVTSGQGATGIIIHNPAFVEPEGVPGPLPVFEWRTSRYQNRIGTWEASIPIDEGLIDGEPLHKQIRRGWHVSLLQENNGPNAFREWYRLYMGVVLERDYEIAVGGSVRLKLSGTFRSQHLADRSTYDGLAYNETPDGIIDDLLDGDNIIGPNDGASYPSNFSTTALNITFHDISRYAAMIKVAELRRVALRESWRNDVPEFVRIDGPPDAHVIITNIESEAENLNIAAIKGFALISGTPRVKFRGQDIVNRIVPIGSDTPDGDLTLQYSTITAPYSYLAAPKPGGGYYYYIEDAESIEKYGLVEMPLIRTDVKNPSDDWSTRQAAANVLYAVAVGEMLRKKSEAMIVEVDLANGQNIWALPGDAVRLQYTGIAQNDNGTFTWLDVDRYFMVTERHDESTPSGVRNVRFVLAAPEIIMEIPDLPTAVPGTNPTNNEPGDNDPSADPNDPDAGDPGDGGGEVPEILPPIDTSPPLPEFGPPDCCDDPEVDIEEGEEDPPEEIGEGEDEETPAAWTSITDQLLANNMRAYLTMISRDGSAPSISWPDAYVQELTAFNVTYGHDNLFSNPIEKYFKLYLIVPTGSGSTGTFSFSGSIDEVGGFVCNKPITDPVSQITVIVQHNQDEDVISSNGLHEISASVSGATASSNKEAQAAWLGAYSFWTGAGGNNDHGGNAAEWNGDTQPPSLLSSAGLFPLQAIGPASNNTGEVSKSETWDIFGPLDTYYSYATATAARMRLNMP